MNTKEALTILKREKDSLEYMEKYNPNLDNIIASFAIAIKSMEKDIGSRPKNIDIEYSNFTCTNCNLTIGYTNDEREHKYCLNCGNKLDWSE